MHAYPLSLMPLNQFRISDSFGSPYTSLGFFDNLGFSSPRRLNLSTSLMAIADLISPGKVWLIDGDQRECKPRSSWKLKTYYIINNCKK